MVVMSYYGYGYELKCSNLPKWTRISEGITNMSGENHLEEFSAASIWAKFFADMLWYCMLWLLLPLLEQQTPHKHAAAESRCNAHYCNYSLHTHACNWYTSVMASFKRQPEKKDALLMRRRGPCSEKARRGLQSWENPAQHKQKHGKEEGRKREKRQKNMNHG